MTPESARILAQLAEGRAMNLRALAESQGETEPAHLAVHVDQLRRAGLIRGLRPLAMPSQVLYEITSRGKVEATGGAQMRIDGAPDRPPVAAQPALF